MMATVLLEYSAEFIISLRNGMKRKREIVLQWISMIREYNCLIQNNADLIIANRWERIQR
jgi:hypothetical protein